MSDTETPAAEQAAETPADVLEGEQLPGVSKENMTRDEAKAAMGEFLAHVGIIGEDGKPVEVVVQDPVVIEGQHERVERPEYAKLAEEQRAQARVEGAEHADLEVGESLDEPVSPDSALVTVEALLGRLEQAVRVLRRELHRVRDDVDPETVEGVA